MHTQTQGRRAPGPRPQQAGASNSGNRERWPTAAQQASAGTQEDPAPGPCQRAVPVLELRQNEQPAYAAQQASGSAGPASASQSTVFRKVSQVALSAFSDISTLRGVLRFQVAQVSSDSSLV